MSATIRLEGSEAVYRHHPDKKLEGFGPEWKITLIIRVTGVPTLMDAVSALTQEFQEGDEGNLKVSLEKIEAAKQTWDMMGRSEGVRIAAVMVVRNASSMPDALNAVFQRFEEEK